MIIIKFYRVFHNCSLYNGIESEVGKIGSSLEKDFDNLCHTYNLNIYLNPPHPAQQAFQQNLIGNTQNQFTAPDIFDQEAHQNNGQHIQSLE